MKIENLTVGDVVQLISGGPKMTVSYAEDGVLNCIWFDSAGDLQDRDFDLKELTLASKGTAEIIALPATRASA